MVLKTYTFSKKHNSTKQIGSATPDATYSNTYLKADCDMDNPVFMVQDSFRASNYCYLEDLGRYYFIDKWVLGNNNIYELHCTVDALATYKSYIGNYTAFVERCASPTYYNVELYDNLISSQENILSITSANTNIIGSGAVYVCRTLNSAYGISTFYGSLSNFDGLFNPDFDEEQSIDDIIRNILTFFLCSPSEYVIDFYMLPVPLGKMTGSPDVLCAGWFQQGGAFRWTKAIPTIEDTITLSKPAVYYTDFRADSDAFTRFYIYIPAVGTLPLAGDLIEKTLTLTYVIDVYTGEIAYLLKADGDIVATYHGNIKCAMQAGTMAPQGGNLITSGASIATAAATGNAIAIGLNTYNTVQNIITPTPSVNGSQGSCASMIAENDVIITQVVKASAESPLAVAGKPCGKNLQLSLLSGFVKCAGASVEVPCNESVKQTINNHLNNGFYYE